MQLHCDRLAQMPSVALIHLINLDWTDTDGKYHQVDQSFVFNSWWRHQIETFSASLAICAGNPPATGEFPAQRSVTRNFDVFFALRLKTVD